MTVSFAHCHKMGNLLQRSQLKSVANRSRVAVASSVGPGVFLSKMKLVMKTEYQSTIDVMAPT